MIVVALRPEIHQAERRASYLPQSAQGFVANRLPNASLGRLIFNSRIKAGFSQLS